MLSLDLLDLLNFGTSTHLGWMTSDPSLVAKHVVGAGGTLPGLTSELCHLCLCAGDKLLSLSAPWFSLT